MSMCVCVLISGFKMFTISGFTMFLLAVSGFTIFLLTDRSFVCVFVVVVLFTPPKKNCAFICTSNFYKVYYSKSNCPTLKYNIL